MLCGIFEYKTPISKVPRGLLLFSCVATSMIEEKDITFPTCGRLSKYWFTKDKIDRIASVHNYLDNLPTCGRLSK